jgi:hypothetical protein
MQVRLQQLRHKSHADSGPSRQVHLRNRTTREARMASAMGQERTWRAVSMAYTVRPEQQKCEPQSFQRRQLLREGTCFTDEDALRALPS